MNRSSAPVATVFIVMLAPSALPVCALGCFAPVADDAQHRSAAPSAVASSDVSDGSACVSMAATIQSPGPPPSTCSTTGRIICTLPPGVTLPSPPQTDGGFVAPPSGVQTIAGLSTEAVTVGTGTGIPPVPVGGAVAPGDYQLVAAAVYGPIPPNVAGAFSPGELAAAKLNVSCDTYNIVFGEAGDGGLGTFGGNSCGRLVPFAVPLAALAGLADAGDVWSDWMPYSASPGKLTLIDTEPYQDFGLGLTEGFYTVVEEFAFVDGSTDASTTAPAVGDSVSALGCASAPPVPPAARDPRCPASPPENSQTCDRNPDPLECEYGGDALGRCTTLAVCALQPDGTYHFVIEPSTNQAECTNPPACPSTYATATEVEAGAVLGECPQADAGTGLCSPGELDGCDYPEGICFCAIAGMASNFGCTPRAANGDCPAVRPLSGDACPSAGLQCYYGNPCEGVYEGMPLVCSAGGYWEAFDAQYSCPAYEYVCPVP